MVAISAETGTSHSDNCATKEYVQKEHKETTRLIVGVALAMVAMMVGTVALVNISLGSRLDDLKNEFKETRLEIKELRAEIKGLSTGQSRIEGFVTGKSPIGN